MEKGKQHKRNERFLGINHIDLRKHFTLITISHKARVFKTPANGQIWLSGGFYLALGTW